MDDGTKILFNIIKQKDFIKIEIKKEKDVGGDGEGKNFSFA